MAIDNLNYYSSWLPAGQLTDKYSSQPWCLRSKNLDIFSSSKSTKATAWSTPSQTGADIIKQDWKLILKTDGKVYDISSWEEVLVVDPSVNFPVYQVSYNWKNGTYADAQRWTVQDLVAKYEWDELKAFTVFTDRASYVYSNIKYVINKSFTDLEWFALQTTSSFQYWYKFTRGNHTNPTARVWIKLENPAFTSFKIKIYAVNHPSDDATISIQSIKLESKPIGYYYDAQLDSMIPVSRQSPVNVSWTWSITDGVVVDIPAFPNKFEDEWYLWITFYFTKKEWASTYWWANGSLYIDMNWWPDDTHNMTIDGAVSDWDYNEYYTYLPVRERKLVSVWDYGYSQTYWMKWLGFQPLYKWTWSWVDVNWEKKTRYDLVTDMGWETDVSMDIVGMMIWNEQVYMIWNMNWNWYIIPCDLSWWRWTPYIAYGCTFTGVANIDYLMYLVWDDRGISQLRAYNWQELVKVIWWNKESNTNDLIDIEEQYKFDWKIVKYRWNLILSTSDNRIFEYGQTYGGKGWAFIHEIPWTIEELKSNWNDLEVKYTNNWATYITTYQDDTPIKNYNTEWEAVYPIVLWNHLLEKEESDLYASYVIPHSSCKLEFWGNANHYTYWSFKVTSNFTPPAWSLWDIQWLANGLVLVTTRLEFVEKNGEWLTFRLVWEMPVMSGNETWRIIYKTKNSDYYLDYTEVNHFRKIWEITTDKFTEWEFRFHNLNNKLELPKSHSLQIMVRGKGTQNYTPELFSLDLVANQRERW
jgi:hypothetical protein